MKKLFIPFVCVFISSVATVSAASGLSSTGTMGTGGQQNSTSNGVTVTQDGNGIIVTQNGVTVNGSGKLGSNTNNINTGVGEKPDNNTSTSKCSINGKEVPCEQVMKDTKKFIGIALWVFLIGGIITLLTTIFWIWMLVDTIKFQQKDKWLWVVLQAILGVVGSIIYYFSIKKHRKVIVLPNQSEDVSHA